MAPDGLWIMVGIIPLPNVGGWIAYGTCAIVSYFTWCPQHTEALMGPFSIADTLEPLATMNDMIDFVKTNVALLKSVKPTIAGETAFSMNGTGGAPLGEADVGDVTNPPEIPVYLLYPDITGNMNESPWFGGRIDLTQTAEEAADKELIISTCTSSLKNYVGEDQADMVCQIHYLIAGTMFFTALLTITDVFIIFFLIFRYLPGYIKRWMNLFSGNTSLLKGFADF